MHIAHAHASAFVAKYMQHHQMASASKVVAQLLFGLFGFVLFFFFFFFIRQNIIKLSLLRMHIYDCHVRYFVTRCNRIELLRLRNRFNFWHSLLTTCFSQTKKNQNKHSISVADQDKCTANIVCYLKRT